MHEKSQDSFRSLGFTSHEDERDRSALESSAQNWLFTLDQQKWPRALQYFENVSYLLGNHLTRFYYTADGGFGFHQFGVHDHTQFDSMVAKSADNKLIRPVETVVSMLTQSSLEGRATPNSDLPEDEDAAALSEIVLHLVWEKPLNMPSKLRDVAMLGCIAGTVAVEIEYGPTDLPVSVPIFKRKRVANPYADLDESQPATVEVETDEVAEYRSTPKMDLQARVWSFFHLTPDPAATSPDDMTWIARSSFEDVDWIRENFDKDEPGYYPENLDNLRSDTAGRTSLYWWYKIADIIETPAYYQHGGGFTPNSFQTQGGAPANQTVFTVIDVKPTSEFPRGRTLILAGGKLIYCGDSRCYIPHPSTGGWRYPWRWHPYAFWGWLRVPGRFWHVPLLSEIVPLQKKINSIDALVHANRQHMALGQWSLPFHCKVPEGMPSGIPGEHFRWRAVAGLPGPEKVDHKPLPAELLAERAQLERSIDHIAASGLTENMQVSRSAARAASILEHLRQERLRSKVGMLQEYEVFLENIAQNILIEIQHNLVEGDEELLSRIAAAAREHSLSAVQSFTGASLRDHHAIKIDVVTAAMRSPEAQVERAAEFARLAPQLAQLAPAEREGVMRAMGIDRFVKNSEQVSVRWARRLISRIVGGQIRDLTPERLSTLLVPEIVNIPAIIPVFQNVILGDQFYDYEQDVQQALIGLHDLAFAIAAQEMERRMALAAQQAQMGAAEPPEPRETPTESPE